jgi:aryl-alcohol dehydrogenase-like predicted oxidoreductase
MTPPRTRWLAPLGREVSRIGLGSVPFRFDRRDGAFAVLDAWAELGGDLVDTAAVYGAGEAESVLGEWLASRDARDRVVILTKGAHPDREWRSRMSPEAIASDIEASLDRLGTDHVDIYMLHRDDPTVPVGELVDALHEHVVAGRARSVGGSNWTPERLEAAAAYAAETGRTPLTSSSVYLGLAEPVQPYTPGCLDAWPAGTRRWYADNAERWPLFAWSSQSGGFFSDDFDPARAAPEAVGSWDTAPNRARRERARDLAARRGLSTPQVALAWVLSQPFQPIALAGLRGPERLRAAWDVLDVELDEAERRWLETGDGG